METNETETQEARKQAGRDAAGFAQFALPEGSLTDCITWAMMRGRWEDDVDWITGFYEHFGA